MRPIHNTWPEPWFPLIDRVSTTRLHGSGTHWQVVKTVSLILVFLTAVPLVPIVSPLVGLALLKAINVIVASCISMKWRFRRAVVRGVLTGIVASLGVPALIACSNLEPLDRLSTTFVGGSIRMFYASGFVISYLVVVTMLIVGCLYGWWTDFSRRLPTIHAMKPTYTRPATAVGASTIVHWSDLHLTAPGEPRIEGGNGGNQELQRLVTKHAVSLDGASALILSGDITDRGIGSEWEEFFRILPPSLLTRCTLLPGNHDVNIPDPHFDSPVELRLVRTMLALNKVQGYRTRIIDSKHRCVKLQDFLYQHHDQLLDIIREGHFLDDGLVRHIWKQIFPMAVEYSNRKLVVICVDSNRLTNNLITNAVGNVGRSNIARLKMLFSRYRGWNQVIALHHHVALPPLDESLLNKAKSTGMVLDNADSFLAAIPTDRARVVFHGHRHIEYHGKIGDRLQVISAPSTTLGNELTNEKPGFYLFQLYADSRRSTFVSEPTWLE
jgi:3',5'-cyclic AMP phosphodiesterase CpdA